MGMFAMGGVASPTAAQDPTATPQPTATFIPSAEGTLVVWVNAEREAVVKAAGEKFKAQYGISVVTQTMGFGDVRNNFNISAPAGEGPDIILGAHDWIGQLYNNGLLEAVDLGATAEKFDPAALGAFTYDGKLVGVPYQVEAIALYYNKDLVPEPPKTMAEAIEISMKLKAEGKVDQGIAIPTDPYHTYPLFTSYGGFVFGRDANGNYDPNQVGLDSEGMLKGAKELDRLVKEGIFSASVGYGEAADLFKKGRLAMWVTGPWELGNIRAAGINYGVAAIPAFDGPSRPFLGVQGFMVSKYAKNLDLAKAFVTEFVATEEIMQALYDAAPAVSAFLPVREANPDNDLNGFAASIAVGEAMPAIPQMSAFWNTMGNAITLIYQQKEDPEKALKDAAAAAREEIAKAK
jgi:maltose/maltodextrin transport system substrate-binding protein/arabinogalactan oligomer/maltooligosaccharide transport system substrate-binding protein